MIENDTKTYSEADIRRMIASGDYVSVEVADEKASPELGREFWDNMRVVLPPAANKVPISLPVDAEVLDWFRAGEGDWLARMNAVLRAYVESRKSAQA